MENNLRSLRGWRKETLNTNGKCFLCVKNGDDDTINLSISSLKYLCQILNFDLISFSNNISRESDFKEENVEIVAPLCSKCGELVKKLSELWGCLEKIKMEVDYYLSLVKLTAVEGNKDLDGKCGTGVVFGAIMAETLRNSILNKCSKRSEKCQPRVTIEKLALCKEEEEPISKDSSPPEFYDNLKLEDAEFQSLEEDLIPIQVTTACLDEVKLEPVFSTNDEDPLGSLETEELVHPPPPDLKPDIASSLYSCDFCDKHFIDAVSLVLHKRKSHPRFRFKCNVPGCKVDFIGRLELDKHMQRRHSNMQASQTKAVEKKLKKLSYLQYIVDANSETSWVSGVKHFKCTICSVLFLNMGRLREHFSYAHSEFLKQKSWINFEKSTE